MSQLAATINLNNTYVLLEKLMHVINKNSIPKCEDLQIFRNLSIRIYRNFEKFTKKEIQYFMLDNFFINTIVTILKCQRLHEHFFDSFFENNMLKCLNHTISKVGSNGSKEPMRNLVIILQDSGFVEYLLHTTSFYANNVNSNSEILYESLFLLTKSFSSNNDIIKYFRKYNTINTCYSMLKIHTCKINVVYTVILVLHRAISQNIGIDMMNKCRLIKILVRLLSMHKRKNYIFEIIMEILVFVTKSKSMVPVLVGVKGISLIIKIMNEKMRNLKNASSIISGIKIIKNISQTNQGTTHFLENEGLSFINSLLKYNVIFEVNIKILTIIHLIIQRCTPKQKLPIDYACLKNKDQFNGQSILKNGSKSGTSSSLSKTADGETLYDSDSDESIDSLCTEGYRVFFDENSIIKSYNYQKVNETLNLSKNETIQHLNMIKAYPDVNNITSYDTLESLTTTNDANKRTFIIQDLKRNFETENIINRVVFDVDEKIVQNPCYKPYSPEKIPNISKSVEDEMLLYELLDHDDLQFESRFECGNLRKAIKIREYEYDLILDSDVSTCSYQQWFYFRISNIKNTNVNYRFNIINCVKYGSQFNAGMQPLMFSLLESNQNQNFWKRAGTNLFYYKNMYARVNTTDIEKKNSPIESDDNLKKTVKTEKTNSICPSPIYTNKKRGKNVNTKNKKENIFIKSSPIKLKKNPKIQKKKNSSDCEKDKDVSDKHRKKHKNYDECYYYTLSFNLKFKHVGDVVYLAYHYPYTYTNLIKTVSSWQKNTGASQKVKFLKLCDSILGYPVPIMIITPETISAEKKYIFLTSRVHPGESNSSFIVKEIINSLMDKSSQITDEVKKKYHFIIIPMLNPDGVLLGNQRCNLSSKDLNRCWTKPSLKKHPTIYHTKKLIKYAKKHYTIEFVCDIHGHSRQKNIFIFGCDHMKSWSPADKLMYHQPETSHLNICHLLNKYTSLFSLKQSNFAIEKSKESTARICLWREFGIKNSYTMESTFCGFNEGIYDGYQLNPSNYKHLAKSFLLSIHQLDVVDFTNFKNDIDDAVLSYSSASTEEKIIDVYESDDDNDNIKKDFVYNEENFY